MKLLYMQEYIKRHLYVIEHEGKYIMVYRSSGLSGTGHAGQLIPFSGIDEGRGLRSNPGYIYKEMFYDGRFVSHHKNIHLYDNVPENMVVIDDFLGDRVPETIIPVESFFNEDGTEWTNYSGFIDYILQTKENLEKARGNLKPFDLAHNLK